MRPRCAAPSRRSAAEEPRSRLTSCPVASAERAWPPRTMAGAASRWTDPRSGCGRCESTSRCPRRGSAGRRRGIEPWSGGARDPARGAPGARRPARGRRRGRVRRRSLVAAVLRRLGGARRPARHEHPRRPASRGSWRPIVWASNRRARLMRWRAIRAELAVRGRRAGLSSLAPTRTGRSTPASSGAPRCSALSTRHRPRGRRRSRTSSLDWWDRRGRASLPGGRVLRGGAVAGPGRCALGLRAFSAAPMATWSAPAALVAWIEAAARAVRRAARAVKQPSCCIPTCSPTWQRRWGPVASPLSWSHAMAVLLRRALLEAEA